jgi:hypothetical protein
MSDHDALKARLDGLSRRIEAARCNAAEGELTPAFDKHLDGFQQRSAAITQKLNDAISKGHTWEMIGYELERDFGSLSDDLKQFEEHLDTEQMRRRRST